MERDPRRVARVRIVGQSAGVRVPCGDRTRRWLSEHPDRTILLTTHYMAEADELCDRLAIIDRGRLLALDSPESLRHGLQREAVFTLRVAPLGQAKERGLIDMETAY